MSNIVQSQIFISLIDLNERIKVLEAKPKEKPKEIKVYRLKDNG